MTQCERILQYMHQNGSITDADARNDLGCTRLAARINNIRNTGVRIVKTMERGQNRFGEPTRYARYRLG